MPDLRPAQRYTKDLLAVERAFFRDAGRVLEDGRRALLDTLITLGFDNYGLIPEVERRVNELGFEIARVGREYSPRLVDVTVRFGERQLGAVRRFESVPELRALRNDMAERRALADVEAGVPAWSLATRAGLSVEINRLRQAGETVEIASERLLSPGLVDGRASAWRRGLNNFDLTAQLALWGASLAILGIWWERGQEQTGFAWKEQAIAAIDERTTDCCLRVHGQIKPLDGQFKLAGTPRFADQMSAPPFHWLCRTAKALYLEAMEQVGVTTRTMRDAARAELEARVETGRRQVIHPAHATSRRP